MGDVLKNEFSFEFIEKSFDFLFGVVFGIGSTRGFEGKTHEVEGLFEMMGF